MRAIFLIPLLLAPFSAQAVTIEDLSIVEEHGVDPSQMQAGISLLSVGTWPNAITSGNYPEVFTNGNNPYSVTAGNIPNALTNGNFPNQYTVGPVSEGDPEASIPQPNLDL